MKYPIEQQKLLNLHLGYWENSPENYHYSLLVTYITMEATIYLLRAMFGHIAFLQFLQFFFVLFSLPFRRRLSSSFMP